MPKTTQRTTPEPGFSFIDLAKALWRFLGTDRYQFLFWITVMIFVSSVGLLPIYIMGKVIDFFTAYKAGESLLPLYTLAGIYGGLYAGISLLRLYAKGHLARIEIDTVYNARVEGFERLMDFSLTWHSSENTGNKIQRIQTGIDEIRAIIKSLSGPFFKTVIALIGVFVIFLSQGWPILFFITAYSLVVVVIERSFYGIMREAQIRSNASNEDSSGTYFESTNNLLTIKTLGLKKGVSAKVAEKEAAAKNSRMEIRNLNMNKWKFFQVWNGLCMGLFIVLIGHRFVDGIITVGVVFTLYTYFNRFKDAISDMADIFVDFIEYLAGISRMMPLYATSEIGGDKPFPRNWKAIRIQEAGFSYKAENSDFTINGLSMEIPRGKKIGIAGRTGSGKSTIVKLLLGLYPLKSGSMHVDGLPISEIKHESLTHNMATVLQETELFNLTLKDNLTLFKAVSPERLEKAIRISQLQEVLDKLPNGLDSVIGEKGYRLSGGERQRLGIARSICAGTEILVFDEATSALDSKTEQAIQEALEKEMRDTTMIVIAHRLSTLKGMDRIYVFENGEILEEGGFKELIEKEGGRFHSMYKLQTSQAE